MTELTRREQVQVIIEAEHDGQRYCPSCGTPLNYDRGHLPNTAAYNTATETVTCLRCKRASTDSPQPEPQPAANVRLAYTNFTG